MVAFRGKVFELPASCLLYSHAPTGWHTQQSGKRCVLEIHRSAFGYLLYCRMIFGTCTVFAPAAGASVGCLSLFCLLLSDAVRTRAYTYDPFRDAQITYFE